MSERNFFTSHALPATLDSPWKCQPRIPLRRDDQDRSVTPKSRESRFTSRLLTSPAHVSPDSAGWSSSFQVSITLEQGREEQPAAGVFRPM